MLGLFHLAVIIIALALLPAALSVAMALGALAMCALIVIAVVVIVWWLLVAALSRCRASSAKCRRLRNCQAAATAVRHVVIADSAKRTVRLGGGEMALDVEGVVDGGVCGKKFLG